MTPQVVGIGEVLIDFIATEPVPYTEATHFMKCFGGAPMNTLVGIARLGISSGAITAVGGDPFGKFLINELKRNGVDTSRVVVKERTRTTITFVANEPLTGERTFIFYRKPWVRGTSDSSLTPEDIDYEYISKAKILHISGFSLSQDPSRRASLSAVRHARKSGVKISFDPTLRSDVWNSENTLRRTYSKMLKLSDIATFSREEAEFILETSDPRKAAEKALRYGVEIVGIKLGSEGAYVKTKEGIDVSAPAFKVKAVDTTGAGDGWNAALIVGLCRGWKPERCVKIANAVGALVVTKHGAITALPYKEELNRFLKEHDLDLEI
ncbi:MAG: sugar kinase [Candidatus Bathyarchaeota archaeon]|nr:sugar kinase [Candidatus Bathyarchaeota archaeon]MDH5687513.1 sugar kinase [Candidatus Bathyarchaeota archaeon]